MDATRLKVKTIKKYKVGGCVRDQIIGRWCKDIDYVVEAASFDEMVNAIKNDWSGEIFLSKPEYLTVRAKVNNEVCDFVLARKDGSYYDGRRPEKVEPGTIYDDLARRDFTMNAIAFDEESKSYIDPHGGINHINRKIICCVGLPRTRFMEDNLRILRAVRFSITLGFAFDGELRGFLIENRRHLVDMVRKVSKERIREELLKCFKADTMKALSTLGEFGLLNIFSEDMWLEPTLKGK